MIRFLPHLLASLLLWAMAALWPMPVAASVPFHAQITDAAGHAGLDPSLVEAVVAVESNFRADAVSNKGAVGLMQLMPDTARSLGVTNRHDPAQNLKGGARYLRSMIDRFRDVRLALAAYNAGPGEVERYNDVPPIEETKRYVEKVLRYYHTRKRGGGGASASAVVAAVSAASRPSVATAPRTAPAAARKPVAPPPQQVYRFRQANGTLMLTNLPPERRGIMRQSALMIRKSPAPTTPGPQVIRWSDWDDPNAGGRIRSGVITLGVSAR
ncbi:MAG: lytic transglycosylase domain-containing protein [Magnetococcus sp. WYHC-3]